LLSIATPDSRRFLPPLSVQVGAGLLKNKKPFRFLRRVFYHACAEASADTVKKGNPERTLRVFGAGYTLPRREKILFSQRPALACVSVEQKSPACVPIAIGTLAGRPNISIHVSL
jgi:hypothetical protein